MESILIVIAGFWKTIFETKSRSSHPGVSCKDVLKNFAKFTRKYLYKRLFLKLAKVFSCEVCEIFKNTFFYGTLLVATSANQHFIDVKIVSGIHEKSTRKGIQESLSMNMRINKTVI